MAAPGPETSPVPERSDLRRGAQLLTGLLAHPLAFVALASLAFIAWRVRVELVILFAAVLFGVSLFKAGHWLAKRTRLSHKVAVGAVYGTTLLLLAAFVFFAGKSLTDQYGQFGERIPSALESVESQLRGVPVVGSVTEQLQKTRTSLTGKDEAASEDMEEGAPQSASGGPSESQTLHFVKLTFRTLSFTGLIFILSLYIGLDGARYHEAILRLVPEEHRAVGRDLTESLGTALPWWLIGRLTSMLVVAILTSIGLFVLGIPLALLLGIIAGIFSFVPVIGPLVSLIPAALITIESSPTKLVGVLVLFAAVQVVESYMVTPQIQRQVASISPLLLLAAQLLLGVLVGIAGVMFATPLALVALVTVQVVYLRHGLDQDVETPSGATGS